MYYTSASLFTYFVEHASTADATTKFDHPAALMNMVRLVMQRIDMLCCAVQTLKSSLNDHRGWLASTCSAGPMCVVRGMSYVWWSEGCDTLVRLRTSPSLVFSSLHTPCPIQNQFMEAQPPLLGNVGRME